MTLMFEVAGGIVLGAIALWLLPALCIIVLGCLVAMADASQRKAREKKVEPTRREDPGV